MPKPALGSLKRLRPDLQRRELFDAQLVETDPVSGEIVLDPKTGSPKLRPLVVYLRPLLPQEKDAIAEEAAPFIARHVTGGFYNEATEEFQKEPIPIYVDGDRVELTPTFVRKLFRYQAMQRPLSGKALPADADPLDVPYLVEMMVTLNDAWPQLEAEIEAVWLEGVSGKAFGLTRSDAPPASSSSGASATPSPSST